MLRPLDPCPTKQKDGKIVLQAHANDRVQDKIFCQ